MTAAKVAAPYRSGLCHSARHDRCRGVWGAAVCDCPCHAEPEPEPEPVPMPSSPMRHCASCTCGDPR